eukprot:1155458-Pelagomonas_calceolata.AAC.1
MDAATKLAACKHNLAKWVSSQLTGTKAGVGGGLHGCEGRAGQTSARACPSGAHAPIWTAVTLVRLQLRDLARRKPCP